MLIQLCVIRYNGRQKGTTFSDTDPFNRKRVKNSKKVVNRLSSFRSESPVRRLEAAVESESEGPAAVAASPATVADLFSGASLYICATIALAAIAMYAVSRRLRRDDKVEEAIPEAGVMMV
jgi:hypothetical protein